jgi:hypothetical protein
MDRDMAVKERYYVCFSGTTVPAFAENELIACQLFMTITKSAFTHYHNALLIALGTTKKIAV